MDLKTLRQERENELAIRENQSNQAVIQQKLDAINNEKTQPERQRKAEQAMLQTERFAATNILPVYDYVINDLVKTIDQVARDAGENISSDFRSEAPTIFASNLEREGIIINGKNTISLGTNSVWSFEISTVTKDFSDRKPIPEDFSHISIVCRTTNGNSILTITPKIKNRGRIFYHPNDILIDENVVIERIAIKLNVPNGFNMNEDRDTANYMGEVELAVRRLIEAQDQLCPLTLRTN